MKAELVPVNGDSPIPITRDLTVIGRRDPCDVQIEHPSLSKRHCVVVKTDGLLVIRDLVTTNGTKVNGQRIRWAALLPNDRVTMGGYKFKVYLGSDEAASPSEQAAARGLAKPKPADARPAGDAIDATPPSMPVPIGRHPTPADSDPGTSERDLAWLQSASERRPDDPIVIDLD